MINKKALWLGLAASLAITPFLVAQLAPPTSKLPGPPGGGDASNPQGAAGMGPLGSPIATADEERPSSGAAPAGPWQEAQILVKPAAPLLPPAPIPNHEIVIVENAAPIAVPMPAAVTPFVIPESVPQAAPAPPQPASPVSTPAVAAQVQPEGKKDEKKDEKKTQDVAAPPATPAVERLEDRSRTERPATFGAPPPPTGTGETKLDGGASLAGGASTLSDVLSKSSASTGIEVQKRSPLVGDPRIDGLHFGQVVTYADGGYWFPARVDLDTVISKLNANISNVDIVKGPFSVRYGPGFSFLNVESLTTPRTDGDYFDAHGTTSLRYQTNGSGWQGQQTVSGGNSDWGFRISYDVQAANDYTTGNGTKMPSSYNNQFLSFAFGFDLSKDSSIEMHYSHVQQSNVLIPGLVTDINELISDAFTARYTAVKGSWYDRLTIDGWVNNTSFNGDSNNPQTRQFIPSLNNFVNLQAAVTPNGQPANLANAPVRLDITTNGNALSYGAREIVTWGDTKGFNISAGADLRVFSSYYNEFDSFNFSTVGNGLSGQPANLGIPYGRQIDPGLLADAAIPIGDSVVVKVGTRVDFTVTQFLGFGQNQNFVDAANPPFTDYQEHVGNPNGDRTYFLFAGYLTAEKKITNELTVTAGYGYAERAPTLTELYAGGAYLGLIQSGLNSFYGNASLRKEEIHQLNIGFNENGEFFRAGANAFYAFMPEYITYTNLAPLTVTATNVPNAAGAVVPVVIAPSTIAGSRTFKFTNTPLATMYGFDAYVEYDVQPWLTPFATLNYAEGWDQSKHEALPGMAPLDTRVGLRFHDRGKNPKWGIEYYARMVADQDQFAASLGENHTGGFVTHNLRAYWQARENLLLLAGVENIGNLQYREALDLRTVPIGVYQPGINFYVGMKVSY